MKKKFKYIGHSDHEITKKQIEFIQQNKDLLKLPDVTLSKR